MFEIYHCRVNDASHPNNLPPPLSFKCVEKYFYHSCMKNKNKQEPLRHIQQRIFLSGKPLMNRKWRVAYCTYHPFGSLFKSSCALKIKVKPNDY